MKEIKKSVGVFDDMNAFDRFMEEDNERPYREKGARRKAGCMYKMRNAYIKDIGQNIWFYSQGFGINVITDEREKNRLLD